MTTSEREGPAGRGAAPGPSGAPAIVGIHHVKLPVTDLAVSLDFYRRLLDAERLPEADHHREDDGTLYAHVLRVPGLDALLELRLDPAQARAQRGFDPFTLAVNDRASLHRWGDRLDVGGFRRSSVIAAIQAWLIVVPDPDDHRIRFYTLEKHGPEIEPDESDPWLSP